MNMPNFTASVIGGGPAGMTAAISAALSGAKTILFEKNDRAGKKLLLTGNGRCNLTNHDLSLFHFHGDSPSFAEAALAAFKLGKTLEFFRRIGLEFAEEEDGKIFPAGFQASGVLDVLRFEMERLGVSVIPNTGIQSISLKDGFILKARDQKEFRTQKLILACGGKSAPQTGSDGSGYRLAEMLGHTIRTPFPSLVQLKLSGELCPAMDGMKWAGKVSVYSNREEKTSAAGDILFTRYGISGLAALSVSRTAVQEMMNGNQTEISIDLLPDMPPEEITATIKNRRNSHPDWTLEHFFTGWINKRIGQSVLKSAGLKLGSPVSSLNEKAMNSIAGKLKDFRFELTGDTGYPNSQVTAGGVDTSEVNPLTMESKIRKSLYFAGEILDIDGDSGGYNLQWAWSSGWLAGKSAGKE